MPPPPTGGGGGGSRPTSVEGGPRNNETRNSTGSVPEFPALPNAIESALPEERAAELPAATPRLVNLNLETPRDAQGGGNVQGPVVEAIVESDSAIDLAPTVDEASRSNLFHTNWNGESAAEASENSSRDPSFHNGDSVKSLVRAANSYGSVLEADNEDDNNSPASSYQPSPSMSQLRLGAKQASHLAQDIKRLSRDLERKAHARLTTHLAPGTASEDDDDEVIETELSKQKPDIKHDVNSSFLGAGNGYSLQEKILQANQKSLSGDASAPANDQISKDKQDQLSAFLSKRLKIMGFDMPDNLVHLASYLDKYDNRLQMEGRRSRAGSRASSRATTPDTSGGEESDAEGGDSKVSKRRRSLGARRRSIGATKAAPRRRSRRLSIADMMAEDVERQDIEGLDEEGRKELNYNLGRLHRTSTLVYGMAGEPGSIERDAKLATQMSDGGGISVLDVDDDEVEMDDEERALKKQKIRHRFIINPSGTFRRCWDLFVLLLILYNALLMPYRLAFELENPGPVDMFDTVADIIFLTDLVLNTRTAYVNYENELVSNPWKILMNYACTWLVIDALSSVPFNLIALASGAENGSLENMKMTKSMRLLRLGKMIRLLRLLRLMKLVKLMGTTEKQMNSIFRVHPGVIKIAKMFMGLMFLFHWFACICGAVAGEPSGYAWNDVWTGVEGYNDHKDGSKYLFMLYFATTSMLGERTNPQSDLQALTSLLITIGGSVIYLGLVSTMLNVLSQIDEGSSAFKNEMDKLHHYMVQRDFPKALMRRIKATKARHHNSSRGFDDMRILENLPLHLRQDVAMFLHRDMIMGLSMFKACSLAFVQDLVMRLKPLPVQPGDYIIRAGTCGTEMFFLTAGTVEVLDIDLNVVATCVPYSFFGEVSIIYNIKRACSVRAADECDLLWIDKRSLMELKGSYPHELSVIAAFAKQRFEKRKLEDDRNLEISSALEHLYHSDTKRFRGLEVLAPVLKKQRIEDNVKQFAGKWKMKTKMTKEGVAAGAEKRTLPLPTAGKNMNEAKVMPLPNDHVTGTVMP
ncbi:hyperpolarization activated cyclic nucleotide-gated potassium channel [Pycnococcus provasolii]